MQKRAIYVHSHFTRSSAPRILELSPRRLIENPLFRVIAARIRGDFEKLNRY